ncbi:hypothetical protein HD806DRAFT_7250 [Xylariaceae sp. AK1471]|nr:hypothetical protein HD806DRAFT_7250 [Xylariaceae sp. AK1471]
MPVTELAWIPSATPGSVPPELIEAGRKGMEAQSEWAAKHASSTLPSGPPAVRGAFLFQQREDQGVVLVTAHWDSPAQHAECIASEENQRAMAAIASLAISSEVKFFHVEGVQMFSTINERLLSVLRIGVGPGPEKKELVERIWIESGKRLLGVAAGFEHVGGWRIEKEGDREEFVVVGAWRDEGALDRFVQGIWDGKSVWDEAWRDVQVLEMDVKTYHCIA